LEIVRKSSVLFPLKHRCMETFLSDNKLAQFRSGFVFKLTKMRKHSDSILNNFETDEMFCFCSDNKRAKSKRFGVSISAASIMDVTGLFLSNTSSIEMQSVREGNISFNHQQYGHAECIHFHNHAAE
jgi:hypothetical protein